MGFDELVIFCRPVGFLGPYPCDDSLINLGGTVNFLALGHQGLDELVIFCRPVGFRTLSI